MKISALLTSAALASGMFAATNASAIINSPVPANAYIKFNNLDWAWAGPCAAVQPSCGTVDLSYQSTQGWRLPTLAEIANAPLATDFLFAGANVPLGGVDPVSGAFFAYTDVTLNQDGAVATPYFNDSYFHADWCNAPGSNCPNVGGTVPWSPGPGAVYYSEALVVRDIVPEPAAWAMMLVGFGGLGVAFRSRRKVAAAA